MCAPVRSLRRRPSQLKKISIPWRIFHLDCCLTSQGSGSKLHIVEMVIKDLGARVESVWKDLRPMTKKLLVGALQSPGSSLTSSPTQQFFYDAHADWEVSRLLSALDEQSVADRASKGKRKRNELDRLAETC